MTTAVHGTELTLCCVAAVLVAIPTIVCVVLYFRIALHGEDSGQGGQGGRMVPCTTPIPNERSAMFNKTCHCCPNRATHWNNYHHGPGIRWYCDFHADAAPWQDPANY